MNRRTVLGAVVAVGLFASGVFAQDQFFAFRGAFVDIEVAPPCALMGPASMAGPYDKNAFLVFTCADNRVVLRRYMNPNDNAIAPVAVYTVANPNTPPTPPSAKTVACTVPGMVTSINGGCVDKNHPLAPRGNQ